MSDCYCPCRDVLASKKKKKKRGGGREIGMKPTIVVVFCIILTLQEI